MSAVLHANIRHEEPELPPVDDHTVDAEPACAARVDADGAAQQVEAGRLPNHLEVRLLDAKHDAEPDDLQWAVGGGLSCCGNGSATKRAGR